MSARSARSQRLRTLGVEASGERRKKRDELKNILRGKLLESYGNGKGCEAQVIVDREISRMMKRLENTKIREVDLALLEENVSELLAQLTSRTSTGCHDEDSLPAVRSSQNSEEVIELPHDSYSVFMEAQSVKFAREKQASKRMESKRRVEMRRILDAQIAERNARIEAEKKANWDYSLVVNKQVKDYHAAEAKKKADVRARNLADKRLRRANMLKRVEAKDAARSKQMAEEDAELRRIRSDLDEEKRIAAEKVREQQQYMRKVQEANAVLRVERLKQKRFEQEQDNLRAEKYAKMLDEQEKQRHLAFEKIKKKSEGSQQMYLKANEQRFKNEEATEKRIRDYHEQKLAEDRKALEDEKRQRKRDKREMNRVLGEQVASRKERARLDKDFSDEFASAYRKEAEDALAKERNDAKLRHLKNLQHKRDLKEQMSKRLMMEDETDPTKMTYAEQRLNAPDLRDLMDDPVLVKEIKGRIDKLSVRNSVQRTKGGAMSSNKPRRIREDYYH